MQRWLGDELDARFLDQLALQSRKRRLVRLDASARQMPAGHVGVPDQKNAAGVVENRRADAKGQPTGEPPVEMERPADEPGRSLFLAVACRHAVLSSHQTPTLFDRMATARKARVAPVLPRSNIPPV